MKYCLADIFSSQIIYIKLSIIVYKYIYIYTVNIENIEIITE